MTQRPIASLLIAGVAMLAFGSAIAAGDAAKEISTATYHARMAAAVKNVSIARAQLQIVINCLVGPKGKEFDSNAENPCKDMGNGALNDFTGADAAHLKLEMAVNAAEEGVHAEKFDDAHDAATRVASYLKDASAAK